MIQRRLSKVWCAAEFFASKCLRFASKSLLIFDVCKEKGTAKPTMCFIILLLDLGAG